MRDIDKYLKLVKHYFNFAGDIIRLEPLETLIPSYDPAHRLTDLRSELNKMSISIHICFVRSGIPTSYQLEDREFDLFVDFFEVISRQEVRHQDHRDLVIEALERAQGHYEKIRTRRRWNLINPVYWIAMLLRIPIAILEFAGVNSDDERTNNLFYWVIQSLMAILLLLLILRLGLPPSVFKFFP